MARLSTAQSSKMCYRLGTSLHAGVDMMRLLQRESESGTPAYRRHMASVADRVSRGSTLAEALKSSDGYFPPLACELVDVGEETGRLEVVLLRLAEHYQHIIKLRRVFLLGILWPSLQLLAAIGVIGLLILLLGALGTSATVFGLSGTRGLAVYFGAVLTIFIGFGALGYALWRGALGSWPRTIMMHIPGIGHATKTMGLARLAWTLSMALESGVDAGRAMRLALQSTHNSYYTRHIDTADAVIARGGQFHEALRRTGAFPEDFLTALENAETSGTESESLSRMSDQYQAQAEAASTALAVIFSMIIWAMVIALLVFLIFYLFMNLYLKPYQDAFEMINNP